MKKIIITDEEIYFSHEPSATKYHFPNEKVTIIYKSLIETKIELLKKATGVKDGNPLHHGWQRKYNLDKKQWEFWK